VLVAAERRGDRLRLSVRDDGVGLAVVPRAPVRRGPGGLGLTHTRERLAALYGSVFALDIARNAPAGTIVTIELPFRPAAVPGLPVVVEPSWPGAPAVANESAPVEDHHGERGLADGRRGAEPVPGGPPVEMGSR